MADVKISELGSSSSVNVAAYVPVVSGDITEKLTVEDIGSINIKKPVRLATTENIGNLYQILNIDGVQVSDGDRVLVKNQTFAEQNGIYVVSSNYTWSRATDFDSNSKITKGCIIYVLEGNQNRLTSWTVATENTNLSIDPISFSQIGLSNIVVSRNAIATRNFGENLFITGSGSGSVQIENIFVTTRTISTEAGTNLTISTRSGSVLLNPRSGNGITVGNINILGETLTSTENLDGNIILSPSGYVIAGNLYVQGNNLGATSGNINLLSNMNFPGNIRINQNSISSINGNVNINSNVNITGNIFISGNSTVLEGGIDAAGRISTYIKSRSSSTLFPIASTTYVDGTIGTLDFKSGVRVATTSNIILSGSNVVVDGINVVAGDRVLVKNQTNGLQNGIYVAASGNWSRSTDANTTATLRPNMVVFVQDGTNQKNTGWILNNNRETITGNALIDSSYVFSQFAGQRDDVEIVNMISDINLDNNSKKFQICTNQINPYVVYLLPSPDTRKSKEIIIKNTSSSFYDINVYEQSTSTLLKTVAGNQSGWFVFDGTNWNSIL